MIQFVIANSRDPLMNVFRLDKSYMGFNKQNSYQDDSKCQYLASWQNIEEEGNDAKGCNDQKYSEM